jgi:dTDP-4-dehydrorhamnose 3,5-epimerase
MKIRDTAIPGVKVFEPGIYADERGEFVELWHQRRYVGELAGAPFVQDNYSFSRHGVLRGLHFQYPNPQGKLVHVLEGEIFDVAVDIRRGSPRFGAWVGVRLRPHAQIYLPPGLAHGFCVTGAHARVLYKCTDFYRPDAEYTLAHDDATLAIGWPLARPLLSDKDRRGLALREIGEELLVPFEAEAED